MPSRLVNPYKVDFLEGGQVITASMRLARQAIRARFTGMLIFADPAMAQAPAVGWRIWVYEVDTHINPPFRHVAIIRL